NLVLPLRNNHTPHLSLISQLDTEIPICKQLVLNRLSELVENDSDGRAEIFSLSSIGGRPLVWRKIFQCTYNEISHFIKACSVANKKVSLQLSIEEADKEVPMKSTPWIAKELKHPSYCEINFDDNPIDVMLRKLKSALHMIPLAKWVISDVHNADTAQLCSRVEAISESDPKLSVVSKPNTSGMSVIACTEILANLTLASYKEDSFGSIQESLGQILLLFCDAYEQLDIHLKMKGLSTSEMDKENRRPARMSQFGTVSMSSFEIFHQNSKEQEDIIKYYEFTSDKKLVNRLHSTFAWAFVNCMDVFGSHLKYVKLETESHRRLKEWYVDITHAAKSPLAALNNNSQENSF
ncbi:hypothetical protein Ciccas_011609, partial [Cichlidogyrus casuarinus]